MSDVVREPNRIQKKLLTHNKQLSEQWTLTRIQHVRHPMKGIDLKPPPSKIPTVIGGQIERPRSFDKSDLEIGSESTVEHDVVNDNDDNVVFEGVVRRRTRRFYVGGIGVKSTAEGLGKFLKEYGIDPLSIKFLHSKRNCLSAKLTVYNSDCNTVEKNVTWPKGVYVRRWYGNQSWRDRFNNQEASEGAGCDIP